MRFLHMSQKWKMPSQSSKLDALNPKSTIQLSSAYRSKNGSITKQGDMSALQAPVDIKSALPATMKFRKPPAILCQTVLSKPHFSYMHLSLLLNATLPASTGPMSERSSLDVTTARLHLTSALVQYLGDTGAAISIEILHLAQQDIWIRVPFDDGHAVAAAAGQWSGRGGNMGWRIKGRAPWLGVLVGNGLTDNTECGLFDFRMTNLPIERN